MRPWSARFGTPAIIGLLFLFLFGSVWLKADAMGDLHLRVSPARAKASSKLVEKGKHRWKYGPAKAFDGNKNTAWCEGVKGSGIGQWLEVRFKKPVLAESLAIMNGFGRNRRLYYANNRVKGYQLELRTRSGSRRRTLSFAGDLNDGACYRADINPLQGGDEPTVGRGEQPLSEYCKNNYPGRSIKQCRRLIKNECNFIADGGPDQESSAVQIPLKKGMCVEGFRLRITSVYRGRKYNDTCVAEIRPVLHPRQHPLFGRLNTILKQKPRADWSAEQKQYHRRLRRELAACL